MFVRFSCHLAAFVKPKLPLAAEAYSEDAPPFSGHGLVHVFSEYHCGTGLVGNAVEQRTEEGRRNRVIFVTAVKSSQSIRPFLSINT